MKGEPKYGEWAFLLGLLLALVLGLASAFSFLPGSLLPVVWAVLAVLGLVVGLMNVSEKEAGTFLLATVALLMSVASLAPILSLLGTVPGVVLLGQALAGFFGAVTAFVSPAAFLVALKAIYGLARD